MLSTTWLVNKLAVDFPEYTFTVGQIFHWSPQEKTIFFDKNVFDGAALLHEISHALLGHRDYTRDLELIEMERDAWQYAANELGERYKVTIDDATIQDALDTYRDWLHARSTCPSCNAIGLQMSKQLYRCIACHGIWKVNEARTCALRRYILK